MRHIPAQGMQRVILSQPRHRSMQERGSVADDPSGEMPASTPTDLRSRYSAVRSASSSPLRDDLDRCLAELDALIAIARAESEGVVTYLHFEMEERRTMIIDALQSGFEL